MSCEVRYCGYNDNGECGIDNFREKCLKDAVAVTGLSDAEIELLIRLVENRRLERSMHLFMTPEYLDALEELVEKLKELKTYAITRDTKDDKGL